MNRVTAREFIEHSRDLARRSRDLMTPALVKAARFMPGSDEQRKAWVEENLRNRMEIVQDCYLTGVEETIRRLHGDSKSEEWKEDFDHEARITELLTKYGLLKEGD